MNPTLLAPWTTVIPFAAGMSIVICVPTAVLAGIRARIFPDPAVLS